MILQYINIYYTVIRMCRIIADYLQHFVLLTQIGIGIILFFIFSLLVFSMNYVIISQRYIFSLETIGRIFITLHYIKLLIFLCYT